MIEKLVIPTSRRLAGVGRRVGMAGARAVRWWRMVAYLRSGRRPWAAGYHEYRYQYLERALSTPAILAAFRERGPLPEGYADRLDARLVEIPWVLSRLDHGAGMLLDAGSSLNSEVVLRVPCLANRGVVIQTLAPETECHWDLGVSYVFGDLRHTLFRDAVFDDIVCISTIEHVGMDNTLYTGRTTAPRRAGVAEPLRVVREFRRIIRPGGTLYVTVPFGRREDHGWFQQFDASMVDELVQAFAPRNVAETIYRYLPGGWRLSDRAACAEAEFFDVRAAGYAGPRPVVPHAPDFAAGERAVACLELHG
jgi:SAM-dependent methyltransferase